MRREFNGVRYGLDVNEDVSYPIHSVLDVGFDGGGDGVGFTYGHVGIDFQMKIDVVLQTGAAGKTFFDGDGAGDMEGGGVDLLHHGGFGHGVDEVIDGAADDPYR